MRILEAAHLRKWQGGLHYGTCHSGLIVAVVALFTASAAWSGETADASKVILGAADSSDRAIGRECRPVACAMFLIYETSRVTVDQLLGAHSTHRIARDVGGDFGAREMRAYLTRKLNSRADSLHLVGAFVDYSGIEEPQIYATEAGDGFACSIRRLRGKTGLTLYQVKSGRKRLLVGDLVLNPTDLLLVRLNVGDRTCFAVARSPFLDPAAFDLQSGEIKERLRAGLPGQSSPARWLYLRGVAGAAHATEAN